MLYFVRRMHQSFRGGLTIIVASLALSNSSYADILEEYEEVHKIQLEAEAIILGAAFNQRRVMETDKLENLRNLVREFANESRLFAEARIKNHASGECKGWAKQYIHESLPTLSRELKKGEDHWRLLFDRSAEEAINDTFYEFGEAIVVCMDDD